jgi:DNA-binding response OmpR family regulator
MVYSAFLIPGRPLSVQTAYALAMQTQSLLKLTLMLMENPNRAFTRGELIEKALGYAYEGMDRTLDSHIKNLRKKIEDDPSAPRYIETVFGVGYRMNDVPEPGTKKGKR